MLSHDEVSQKLRGVRVWVAGAAKSGTAAAKLLRREGARVFVTDSATISEEMKNQLRDAQIDFEEKGHNTERFKQECELLVLSPAIPLDSGLALTARQHGIAMVSEIEVASWFLGAYSVVCGVTGTNGKSTTTNYLGQLLALGRGNGIACGNIGYTFAEAVMRDPNLGFAVELSSYQLETTYSLRPHVSILLNLQNDHQARYRNLDEYLKAKWRLLLMTRPDGVAIIEREMLAHGIKLGLPLPSAEVIVLGPVPEKPNTFLATLQTWASEAKTLPQALYGKLNELDAQKLTAHYQLGHAHAQRNLDGSLDVFLRHTGGEKRLHIASPCLPGEHNAQNLLAASVAGLYLGMSDETIVGQWEAETTSYSHLPHRLEIIGRKGDSFCDDSGAIKKITVINDSKATNVESVIVALRSFDRPIQLLLGGDPKGESYLPIASFAGKPVTRVFPFGKAGAQIHKELSEKLPKQQLAAPVPSLFGAASNALAEAKDGDIVLLSPACASFDEFKNFEHRGDAFRLWALKHLARSES